ncbi:hypothetical protein DMNBHIDG_01244 [Candidatus Methanoperedenaceae archaeon GB37]|nr:hypothetical protein DMNBHIDG_01244 [Candidatus Methanoperedenaceae archaeon GB37]
MMAVSGRLPISALMITMKFPMPAFRAHLTINSGGATALWKTPHAGRMMKHSLVMDVISLPARHIPQYAHQVQPLYHGRSKTICVSSSKTPLQTLTVLQASRPMKETVTIQLPLPVLPGWTRNGGICEKTEDACPQGYDYYFFNVICQSGTKFTDSSDGTCAGCPAGYTCRTNYETCTRWDSVNPPPCPSGEYEYESLGACFWTSTPSCSYECTRNGGTCNCTQSACPAGYDYFADMDICYQWTQVACLPGYTWNGSSSLCEKYEEAQCASGERKNDPETGEAGCYIFKRHIYCRTQNPDDPCTYGNLVFYQDDCYCKSEPNCDNLNEDVIIGTTHKNPDTCWALDHKLCPANNQFKDRGELKSEDRCLEKVLCPEEVNKPASAGDTTWTLARVAAYQNFGSTESIGLRGEYTDTETGITYGISLPTGQTVGESGFASCPLGNGSKCQEIIPFYWACGSEHQCDACFAPPLNPYYSIIQGKGC